MTDYLMRGTIVELKQVSGGCPEQWEGKLSNGDTIYARERHGWIRIEINGVTVHEQGGEDVYEVLLEMFTIDCEDE